MRSGHHRASLLQPRTVRSRPAVEITRPKIVFQISSRVHCARHRESVARRRFARALRVHISFCFSQFKLITLKFFSSTVARVRERFGPKAFLSGDERGTVTILYTYLLARRNETNDHAPLAGKITFSVRASELLLLFFIHFLFFVLVPHNNTPSVRIHSGRGFVAEKYRARFIILVQTTFYERGGVVVALNRRVRRPIEINDDFLRPTRTGYD